MSLVSARSRVLPRSSAFIGALCARRSAVPFHLVPEPHVADLDALNTMLVAACRADEVRALTGRSETIGAAMAIERGHPLACATEGLDLAEIMFPLVDKRKRCATPTWLFAG
jgi:hypothetical protein